MEDKKIELKKLELEELKIKEGLLRTIVIALLTVGAGAGTTFYTFLNKEFLNKVFASILFSVELILIAIVIILWADIRNHLKKIHKEIEQWK